MQISHLSLTNFRNYARLELELPPGAVVLQGDNAQGKTNLLEAIHYLSRIRSPRTKADSELVNWLAMSDSLPFARLVGRFQTQDDTSSIEVSLVQAKRTSQPGVPVLRKHVRVNGVDRRARDAVGLLSTVLFLPEDIDLVSGSPYLRRRYLDDTISQLDSRYRRELEQFNRVLTQRNHLLKSLRHSRNDSDQLAFWDRKLAQHGAYLISQRRRAVSLLNSAVQHFHPTLTGGSEWLRLEYCGSVLLGPRSDPTYQMDLPTEAQTTVLADIPLDQISATYLAQLGERRDEELDRGVSVLGPHRDDLRFVVNGIDMRVFGSRGQQRTAALSLKLAEVEWLAPGEGDKPVLLLDDTLSELDAVHRDCLMSTIGQAQQVVVTTTDFADFGSGFLERSTLWQVADGRIQQISSP